MILMMGGWSLMGRKSAFHGRGGDDSTWSI